MAQIKSKEPFIRVAKKDDTSQLNSWVIRIIAILLSLIVCGVLIVAVSSHNPLAVYSSMIKGTFGSTFKVWVTAKDTAFLLLIALALAPAFKMRFWNIGAEGQVLIGAVATAGVMIYFGTKMSTPVLFITMFLVSVIAGAIWAIVPGFFKAYFNTNETLFTLMMNYVAIQVVAFCVSKWEHPAGSNSVGIINMSTKAGWLPTVFDQKYFLNVAIVLVVVVAMYVYLNRSKHGYEISVVGESVNTAKYAGINVKKVIVRTMSLSGALCGFAGFIAVTGASHSVSINTASGNGFTAIIIAWLAKFDPVVMIIYSFIIAFLNNAAIQVASDFYIDQSVSKILTGIILFFILGSEFFINYKVIIRSKNKKEVTE